ncbi:hypothetical protein AW118_11230 [Escherichia coli]|uniref:Uncharacterized protein n=1 Tax=Escherichia coli TaxID=562 RepID=A0A1Q6B9V3_ECOLX|nr:hypothetical protein [Escherichia coli]OKU94779.1 hypothetical protein AWP53_29270 [Escherichia coli]OKV06596.1 hypothetical protein AWP47_21855 [Escherichia coli]OKV22071.1 hypothetical protein AWP54_15460 [Escherichia coli]OKV49784.1 hypothetical protein AWP62_24335 [Escherichia coli]
MSGAVVNDGVMRIFHPLLAVSSSTNKCFIALRVYTQHYANGTKTITFFCDWRYNLPKSQFSKSEEYC